MILSGSHLYRFLGLSVTSRHFYDNRVQKRKMHIYEVPVEVQTTTPDLIPKALLEEKEDLRQQVGAALAAGHGGSAGRGGCPASGCNLSSVEDLQHCGSHRGDLHVSFSLAL